MISVLLLLLTVAFVCDPCAASATACPRDQSHREHQKRPNQKRNSPALDGDLKALYYGEVCLSCLRDGTHSRPLVAVPEVDAATSADIINAEAVLEAPEVRFEIVDRRLVAVHVVAGKDGASEILPHLPPFRILISDGESDDTPLAQQLVILNTRSNHTFLDTHVQFPSGMLHMLHIEPLKVFFIRLDTYSRRLSTLEGAFWVPFGVTASNTARTNNANQQGRRSTKFVVTPPATSGLGTRFHATLSLVEGAAPNTTVEIWLDVVVQRKAPVPPQRVELFLIEAPTQFAPPTENAGHIVIESDPKGFVFDVAHGKAAAGTFVRLNASHSHAPSVRLGLEVSTSWVPSSFIKTSANNAELLRRLWAFLNANTSEQPSPPPHRYAILIRCVAEELRREYHEEYSIPHVHSLLQRLRGVTSSFDDDGAAQGIPQLPSARWMETIIPPDSYSRLLTLEPFQIQPDGSSIMPPDEPFLRVLLRYEPEHNAVALFLLQPVPIRNLQIFVVNGDNDTVLLEEAYEVPFIGPDRDIGVHPLFGVRRFLPDDVTWVSGDELRIYLFFDLRDVSSHSAPATTFPAGLHTPTEDAGGHWAPEDPLHTLLGIMGSTVGPFVGHTLLALHRQHLAPRYSTRASEHVGDWHHHAVRDAYEHHRVIDAILHWVEQSEGHVDHGLEVIESIPPHRGSHELMSQLRLRALDSAPSVEGQQLRVAVSIPVELVITSNAGRSLDVLSPLFSSEKWRALDQWQTFVVPSKIWSARRMREVLEITLFTLCGGDHVISGVQHHVWLNTMSSYGVSLNTDVLEASLEVHGLSNFAKVMRARQDFIEAAFEIVQGTLPWLYRAHGLNEDAWLQRVNAVDALAVEWLQNASALLPTTSPQEAATRGIGVELFVAPLVPMWCPHSDTPTAVMVLNTTRRTVDIVVPSQATDGLALDLTCDWAAVRQETTLTQLLRYQRVISESAVRVVDVTVRGNAANRTFWLTSEGSTLEDLTTWIRSNLCTLATTATARSWRQPPKSEKEIAQCVLRRTAKLLQRRRDDIQLVPLTDNAEASPSKAMPHFVRISIAKVLKAAHLVLSLHLHEINEQLQQLL